MVTFTTPERFDELVCNDTQGTFITICANIVTLYHYNKNSRQQLLRDCHDLFDALSLASKLHRVK